MDQKSAGSNKNKLTDVIESGLDFTQIGKPELISDRFLFTEGPLWERSSESLLFSDIAGDTIYRLIMPGQIDVYRRPSQNSNGLAFDISGNLLAAEHGSRNLTSEQEDGTVEVLAGSYMGRRLHSPNDIAVRSDGTIYFTDPPYGLGGRRPELDFMGLFRVDPDGSIKLEGKFYDCPNGVVLSPDEKTLYLALTESDEILAFDVAQDGTVEAGRGFAYVPYPDGMAVDLAGNIYIAALDGVQIFSSNGKIIGTIVTQRQPANCAFGGKDGKTLFITARDSLYRVDVPIAGF